jgi:hypothetical protein
MLPVKNKYSKAIILFCSVVSLITACDTQGQIGDTVNFKTSHAILNAAIDTLYFKNPEYKIPAKWLRYDNFAAKPSTYLFKKIFYFKDKPEEMYYVSLIDDSIMTGDTSQTGLAIRAVNRGDEWMQVDKFDYKQQRKIQRRFNKEIISKLKEYTKARVYMEE